MKHTENCELIGVDREDYGRVIEEVNLIKAQYVHK
jgi:hypothetical protein